MIRDFEDAAQCWPGTIWPGQAQRPLRGLIKAWHHACEQGHAEIPPEVRNPLIRQFRHAVLAGLSDVPRIPDVLSVPRGAMTGNPCQPPLPATPPT